MWPQAGAPGFVSTQWSLVLAARDGDPGRAQSALESLCGTYWRPLYLYVRRCGHSVEDAQDLTQSFFARLLEKHGLQRVDPALGKFRAFLLTALKNFMVNEWRRDQAQKRGGNAAIVNLEEMTRVESGSAAELACSLTPERVYERNWALALLSRTTARLEAEFATAGKAEIFERIKPYLTGDRGVSYADVAAALGISEVTVRVSVHRMRGRFRDLLQREVADTLADPHDSGAVEAELRYLLTVL